MNVVCNADAILHLSKSILHSSFPWLKILTWIYARNNEKHALLTYLLRPHMYSIEIFTSVSSFNFDYYYELVEFRALKITQLYQPVDKSIAISPFCISTNKHILLT